MERNPFVFIPAIVIFATLLGGGWAHYQRGRTMILTGAIVGFAAGAMIGALLLYASAVLVPLAMFGLIAVAALGWLFC
ncbi:MAG: hypothetical protein AB7O60_09640 [Variibacter sp.]